MATVYQAEYAGYPVRYAFQYPKTRTYFRSWLKPVSGEEYDVSVTPEQIQQAYELMQEGNAEDYAEYKALIGPAGRYLLRYHCCIFHSVAFLWKGRAWLLAAPSGTGKSTQFFNWRRLFPGEIMMICGDMPVLEQREDGSIWVHPTHWNGKESIGSHASARLGGIVVLEQAGENRMDRLTAHEALVPVVNQFCAAPETEEEIRTMFGMLDRMLGDHPVWKLRNLGDDASTLLLRESIAKEAGGEHGAI